jgi:hypothetical protein
MSSNTERTVAADQAREQPMTSVGRERADSLYGENEEVKKTEEPKATPEKLLDLLTGLAGRMERLEASQERQEEKERLKGPRGQRVWLVPGARKDDALSSPGRDSATTQLPGAVVRHVLRHEAAGVRKRDRQRRDGTGAAGGAATALCAATRVPAAGLAPAYAAARVAIRSGPRHASAQARYPPIRRQGAVPGPGERVPFLGEALRTPDPVCGARERVPVDGGHQGRRPGPPPDWHG